jgi:hypothetical protein
VISAVSSVIFPLEGQYKGKGGEWDEHGGYRREKGLSKEYEAERGAYKLLLPPEQAEEIRLVHHLTSGACRYEQRADGA